MAKLSREDILKLAKLSRLGMTEEEVLQYQNEITEILGYVELLQQVDVDGLSPTTQVTGLKNVVRKDTIKDYGYTPSTLLENVPQTMGDHIKVKRMIT